MPNLENNPNGGGRRIGIASGAKNPKLHKTKTGKGGGYVTDSADRLKQRGRLRTRDYSKQPASLPYGVRGRGALVNGRTVSGSKWQELGIMSNGSPA